MLLSLCALALPILCHTAVHAHQEVFFIPLHPRCARISLNVWRLGLNLALRLQVGNKERESRSENMTIEEHLQESMESPAVRILGKLLAPSFPSDRRSTAKELTAFSEALHCPVKSQPR